MAPPNKVVVLDAIDLPDLNAGFVLRVVAFDQPPCLAPLLWMAIFLRVSVPEGIQEQYTEWHSPTVPT